MSFRTNVRNLDLSVDSDVPKDDPGATLRFLTFVRNDMIYNGCGKPTGRHSFLRRAPRGMAVNLIQDLVPAKEMLNRVHYHPITGGNGLFSGYFTLSSVWFCKYTLSVFWALPFASAQPRRLGANAAAMSFRTNVRNLDLSVDSDVPKDDPGATLRFLTFVRNDMIYDGCGRTSTAPHCGMVVNRVQHDK